MAQLIVQTSEGLFSGISLARSGEAEWRQGADGYPFIAGIQTFQVFHALTTLGFVFQMAGYSPISTRTFVLLHTVPAISSIAAALSHGHPKITPYTHAIHDNIGNFCKTTTLAACIAQIYLGAYTRPLACIGVIALDNAIKGGYLPQKAANQLHKFDLHEAYARTHTFAAIIAGTAMGNYIFTVIGSISLYAWILRLYRQQVRANEDANAQDLNGHLTPELLKAILSDKPPALEINPAYMNISTLPSVDERIDFRPLGKLFDQITFDVDIEVSSFPIHVKQEKISDKPLQYQYFLRGNLGDLVKALQKNARFAQLRESQWLPTQEDLEAYYNKNTEPLSSKVESLIDYLKNCQDTAITDTISLYECRGNLGILIKNLKINTRFKSRAAYAFLPKQADFREHLKGNNAPLKEKTDQIVDYIAKNFKDMLVAIEKGSILPKKPWLLNELRTRLRLILAKNICKADPTDYSSVNADNITLDIPDIDILIQLATEPVGYCDAKILEFIQQIDILSSDPRIAILNSLLFYRKAIFKQLLREAIPSSNYPILNHIFDFIRQQLTLVHVNNFMTNLLGQDCGLQSQSAASDTSASIGPTLELVSLFLLEPRMKRGFNSRHTPHSIEQVTSKEAIGEKDALSFGHIEDWWADWIANNYDEEEATTRINTLRTGTDGTFLDQQIENQLFYTYYIGEKDTEHMIINPKITTAMLFDMGTLRLVNSDAVEAAS